MIARVLDNKQAKLILRLTGYKKTDGMKTKEKICRMSFLKSNHFDGQSVRLALLTVNVPE